MPSTNLISNGDMSHGTQHWSGSNLTVSNGVLTVQGNLYHDQFIPVANNRIYRLSYDMKCNSKGSSTSAFLSCMYPYDNTRNMIGINTTNGVANTITTLAKELKSGDTTATLTSAANWNTTVSHHRMGICTKKAWGTNRSLLESGYTAINGNVLTLSSAWNKETIPAGTAVRCFLSGSTYYYPNSISNASLPTDWTHYSVEFNGGNNIRYSCQYVKFATLGYTYNCSFRNIRLECINDIQYCNDLDSYNYTLSKQGVLTSPVFKEDSDKIRYIKDSISGSTVNDANHWCEFQVINDIGENLAWGRDVELGSTNISNSVATDGVINSAYIDGGSSNNVLTFDLGYIEDISKIKIWHYYPDGRTYHNNVVQVSADGTNWRTVYQGEKPETSAGNEILIHPHVQLTNNGVIYANNFYEI